MNVATWQTLIFPSLPRGCSPVFTRILMQVSKLYFLSTFCRQAVTNCCTRKLNRALSTNVDNINNTKGFYVNKNVKLKKKQNKTQNFNKQKVEGPNTNVLSTNEIKDLLSRHLNSDIFVNIFRLPVSSKQAISNQSPQPTHLAPK